MVRAYLVRVRVRVRVRVSVGVSVRVRVRVRLRLRVRVRGGVAQPVPFDQPAQPLATLALLDPLAPRRSTRHELLGLTVRRTEEPYPGEG